MFAWFAVLAVAVVLGGSSGSSSAPATRALPAQLIHRCPPVTTCAGQRIIALMKAESTQIWSYLDVRIEWIDPRRVAADAPRPLIVFLEEAAAPAPWEGTPVLASLHLLAEPCEGGVARVWVKNVKAHVESVHVAGVPFLNLPNRLTDLILARALGRVLAHEIGHYLLGTRTHATRGLMRAQYGPLEWIAPPSPALYGLDARERESLASRGTNPTPSCRTE
jgi:hypothetical protein